MWKDILANPDFQAETSETQRAVAMNYFMDRVMGDPGYQKETPLDQYMVAKNFFATVGIRVPGQFPQRPLTWREKNVVRGGAGQAKIGELFMSPITKFAESEAAVTGVTLALMQTPLKPDIETATGMARGVLKLTDSLTSPFNLVLMLGGGLIPGIAGKLLSAVFAVDMTKNSFDASARALEAYKAGNKEAFGEAVVDAAGSGLFALLSASHLKKKITADITNKRVKQAEAEKQKLEAISGIANALKDEFTEIPAEQRKLLADQLDETFGISRRPPPSPGGVGYNVDAWTDAQVTQSPIGYELLKERLRRLQSGEEQTTIQDKIIIAEAEKAGFVNSIIGPSGKKILGSDYKEFSKFIRELYTVDEAEIAAERKKFEMDVERDFRKGIGEGYTIDDLARLAEAEIAEGSFVIEPSGSPLSLGVKQMAMAMALLRVKYPRLYGVARNANIVLGSPGHLTGADFAAGVLSHGVWMRMVNGKPLIVVDPLAKPHTNIDFDILDGILTVLTHEVFHNRDLIKMGREKYAEYGTKVIEERAESVQGDLAIKVLTELGAYESKEGLPKAEIDSIIKNAVESINTGRIKSMSPESRVLSTALEPIDVGLLYRGDIRIVNQVSNLMHMEAVSAESPADFGMLKSVFYKILGSAGIEGAHKKGYINDPFVEFGDELASEFFRKDPATGRSVPYYEDVVGREPISSGKGISTEPGGSVWENIVNAMREAFEAMRGAFEETQKLGISTNGMNDRIYARVKPHLDNLWNALEAAGKGATEFMNIISGQFGDDTRVYGERFLSEKGVPITTSSAAAPPLAQPAQQAQPPRTSGVSPTYVPPAQRVPPGGGTPPPAGPAGPAAPAVPPVPPRPRTPAQMLEDVEAAFKFNEDEIKLAKRPDFYFLYRELKRRLVDVSGNVRQALVGYKDPNRAAEVAAHKAGILRTMLAGAHSKAMMMLDGAYEDIYKGLKKGEKELVDRLIYARRVRAIESYKQPGRKYLNDVDVDSWRYYADHFRDTLSREAGDRISRAADKYFSHMKSMVLDQLYRERIISEAEYRSMAGLEYSPLEYIDKVDPEKVYKIGGRSITVRNSGIKVLGDKGSVAALQTDSRLLLEHVVARTQGLIFRNRANRALLELATHSPDNPIVSIAERVGTTRGRKPLYRKAGAKEAKVSLMVDGVERQLVMNEEIASEWVQNDPEMTGRLASFIRWASGSKILKATATGMNPSFALTNFPRDLAHIWLTTQEYSSLALKGVPQMLSDIVATAGDAWLRRGTYKDFIMDGGGMELLTAQGYFTTKGPLGQLQKVLGYLGETSEVWTRLALRRRAKLNGKTNLEASWVARNYLDFSQGGNLVKAIDTGIPYLNAGIQATRGLARAASMDPGLFLWKLSQLGMIAFGVTAAAYTTSPKTMAQVTDEEANANFIFPLGDIYYIDEKGNKRYRYVRIPKDQGQRMVCTLFEALAAKFQGREFNWNRAAMAARDIIPITPEKSLPPTLDAFLGYASNMDYWRMEPIWKERDVNKWAEVDDNTNPIAAWAGDTFKVSPARAQYALEQFIAQSNLWTHMVGLSTKAMLDKLTPRERDELMGEFVRSAGLYSKLLRATNPYVKMKESTREYELEENTLMQAQDRTFDDLFEGYWQDKRADKLGELMTFIRSQRYKDQVRLTQRFATYAQIWDIRDRVWWQSVAKKAPVVRARAYFERWKHYEDDDGRKEMDRVRGMVPGFSTDEFEMELDRLRRGGK